MGNDIYSFEEWLKAHFDVIEPFWEDYLRMAWEEGKQVGTIQGQEDALVQGF